jgi:hypothetical protein
MVNKMTEKKSPISLEKLLKEVSLPEEVSQGKTYDYRLDGMLKYTCTLVIKNQTPERLEFLARITKLCQDPKNKPTTEGITPSVKGYLSEEERKNFYKPFKKWIDSGRLSILTTLLKIMDRLWSTLYPDDLS